MNPLFLLYEISYENDDWRFLLIIANIFEMRRFNWYFLGLFFRDLKATLGEFCGAGTSHNRSAVWLLR
jgi:hypothetical protein